MGLRYFLIGLMVTFITGAGYGQFSIRDFSNIVQSYSNSYPFKRTHIILNQNKFVPDDTVRVRIFYTDSRNALIPGSELIHLELVDGSGKSWEKILLKANHGEASTYFVIPAVPEGIYKVVGYSNYMRNFPTTSFGSEPLIVTTNSAIRLSNPDLIETDKSDVSIRISEQSDSLHVLLRVPHAGSDAYRKLFVILLSDERTTVLLDRTPSARYTYSLALKELAQGLNQIFVVDPQGNVLASNSFLHQPVNINMGLLFDKDVYKPRERVQVDLTLTDNVGHLTAGTFVLKVINPLAIDSTLHKPANDYQNLIELSSLPWDSIYQGHTRRPYFKPSNVLEKKGIVLDADGKPVPDNTQVFFLLQKEKFSFQTTTYQKGRVNFTIPDFTGRDELFYMAHVPTKGIVPVTIEWAKDKLSFTAADPFVIEDQTDLYAEFSRKVKLIDQSFEAFQPDPPQVQHSTKKDFEKMIASADVTIELKDYKPFSTMAELIKEILPSVWYRKISGRELVRVALPAPLNAQHSPVYIVDGIATLNSSFILNLNPNDLEEIKVISNPRKLIPLGLLGRNGIIIINSKSGNMRESMTNPDTLIYGLAPGHTITNLPVNTLKTKPVFRSTIYWNPDIKIQDGKASVTFNLTDDVGLMMLYIEGYTSTGEYVYKRKTLQVSTNGQ